MDISPASQAQGAAYTRPPGFFKRLGVDPAAAIHHDVRFR